MQCLTVDGPKYTSVQNQVRPPRGWIWIIIHCSGHLLLSAALASLTPEARIVNHGDRIDVLSTTSSLY